MLRKISICTIILITIFSSVFAQDSTKKASLAISGSVDVYYRYNFNKQASNNKTSFTNSHNSFELGSARVKFEHTINKIDMVAELAFGKRAEEFSYNDGATRAAIRQLYVSYFDRGTYDIEGGASERVTDRAPVIWLHSKAIDLVKQPDQTLNVRITIERFQYPSVNIVGKIEGTEPTLKNES